MKLIESDLLDRCVTNLRDLPFVTGVDVRRDTGTKAPFMDAEIEIRTDMGVHSVVVEVKRTHLTRTIVQGTLADLERRLKRPWMLCAPHVGRILGKLLADHDVNYMDAAGNCRLRLEPGYFVVIEGRATRYEPAKEIGIRAPGFQVLFALLARPTLLNAPIRTLAEAAGVGKTAAAERLIQLRQDGFIVDIQRETRVVRFKAVLDQWLAGYETQVRPRLVVGRYRIKERDPDVLERRIEAALPEDFTWAWGGGAAAMRLTGFYRGDQTILHVDRRLPDLAKRIRALPADDGPLTVLRAPGPIAFEGVKPRTVHPLLVYTELLAQHDDRARAAAEEVRQAFLEDFH